MYRRAIKTDIDEIIKIPGVKYSKEELESFLKNGYKYLYVYENTNNTIVGASIFGSDEVDDDDYDSEIYGMYIKNVKDKDTINAEMLFETKQQLFDMGFRNLIVWVDDNNEKMQKYLVASGGKETKKREFNGKIQTAYTYALVDMNIE